MKCMKLDVQEPLEVSFKESFARDNFNDVSIVPKTRKKGQAVCLAKSVNLVKIKYFTIR